MSVDTHHSNESGTADRGVSPVIGVVLMVAITVALAATIGAFVMGLHPGSDPAPTATLEVSTGDGSDTIVLSHRGGDPVDLDEVAVLVDGDLGDGNASLEGTLEPGEHVTVAALTTDDWSDITVRHDPSNDVLVEDSLYFD